MKETDIEKQEFRAVQHKRPLSNEDALLYDRQIRLWGIEAQQRMMDARVLFLGKNGIQEEAMKNLVLAGVGVTLASDSSVNANDVACSFFLEESDIGNNYAESLVNRMKNMIADRSKINFISACISRYIQINDTHVYDLDDAMLEHYDVVCVAGEDYALPKMIHVNQQCRQRNVAFFASMGNGTQGFFFQDLNEHVVLEKCSKANGYVNIHYRSLSEILNEPKFPKNCDIAVRTTMAYLLIERTSPDLFTPSSKILGLPHQLTDICNAVGADVDNVLTMGNMQGRRFAVTSGILGGYLVILSIGTLARPLLALYQPKGSKVICAGVPFRKSSVYAMSIYTSAIGHISLNKPKASHNFRDRCPGFLRNSEPSSDYNGSVRLNRFTLFDKTKKVDEVYKTLCDSLKTKKTTFGELKNRLKDAGVTIEGCQKPEDVILRVAQLEVLGKDCLKDEIRKSNPTFQAVLNDVFTENLTTYRSKSDKDKKDFIDHLRAQLISKHVNFDQHATNEEIIRIASEYECHDILAFKLPPAKPANEMSQRIDSYKDEADSIFAIYNAIKDEKMRDKFISQVKDELRSLSIDHKDCKKSEELINRLAYGRVFPQTGKHRSVAGRTTVEKSRGNAWDENILDSFDPISSMFHGGHTKGIFDFNTDSFENDSGIANLFGEDGPLESSFSMLKDIAKMFGVNLENGGNKQIVFENQETTRERQSDEPPDEQTSDGDDIIDDDELQPLFVKTKQKNDQGLLQTLTKCAKDPELREALKRAYTDGLAEFSEECDIQTTLNK
ncbi:SUMO-1-activating enzyme E1A, putative [Babesia caballi]|uniref:SUMO-1-activating enzyme E1A, putative n=1 Tax=Babesia caballi TaxID=5871 RepID=A0AAV4LPS1_BABCB|nr:SUMO-1-activating enzyme E1A, putative [Babesia caballi]